MKKVKIFFRLAVLAGKCLKRVKCFFRLAALAGTEATWGYLRLLGLLLEPGLGGRCGASGPLSAVWGGSGAAAAALALGRCLRLCGCWASCAFVCFSSFWPKKDCIAAVWGRRRACGPQPWRRPARLAVAAVAPASRAGKCLKKVKIFFRPAALAGKCLKKVIFSSGSLRSPVPRLPGVTWSYRCYLAVVTSWR